MAEDSKKKLEQRIKNLEDIISKKGVGSSYLKKVERVQRDVNIALMLGTATALLGVTAWMFLKSRD